MKTNKFLFIVIILCIISGINICVNINSAKENSDLLLENINAIAYGESFEWDGTEWNTDDGHWLGKNWKPVLIECTVTSSYPPFFEETTYKGKMVTCNSGDGNCIKGSPCTNS